jgi:hypothetical protein
MLLAGVDNIREVILFPTLRPEQGLSQTGGPQAELAVTKEETS